MVQLWSQHSSAASPAAADTGALTSSDEHLTALQADAALLRKSPTGGNESTDKMQYTCSSLRIVEEILLLSRDCGTSIGRCLLKNWTRCSVVKIKDFHQYNLHCEKVLLPVSH